MCNRLDKFTEVELDFDAVNWMGQGFAHQSFVVFQNEHPEIRLIPVNMGKDVEAMYRHVDRVIRGRSLRKFVCFKRKLAIMPEIIQSMQ